MKLFNILAFIAAAIIIVFNKWLLDYAEKRFRNEGKPFDRQTAFILTMCAVVILILKGIMF